MMSPVLCRPWKVLLLPSRLAYSSSRDVALYPLSGELDGIVAHQPGQSLAGGKAKDGQGDGQQRRRCPAGRGDQIKGSADIYLVGAVEIVVEYGGQDGAQGKDRVPEGVRPYPARRPRPVVAVFLLRLELALACQFLTCVGRLDGATVALYPKRCAAAKVRGQVGNVFLRAAEGKSPCGALAF